jgi:tRNA(Ile)-lysidine synthase
VLKAFETSVNLQNWDLGRRPTLLAVSGGVDSVAMARLFAMKGYPFAMAHVNFGLRGKESEGDELFVRGLAKELGVEVFVERVDVGGYRRANGISVQMAARELRYSFFRRVMRERGFERLATGHHANDNLEHFFVYLYRGNTAVAWRGIWQEQGDVVRPLLGFLKSELEEFLVAGGWLWREDRSNGGVGYLRNKVRHFVMPGLDDFAKEFYGLSVRKQQTLRGWQAQQAGLWGEHCEERDGGLWVPSVYLALADEGYWMDRLMGM